MTAIEFNNISKQYRLGLVSTKTLQHDLNRWWKTSVKGQEDPYLKIGEANDRSIKGESEYVWALKDIDFKVEQGDVLGIIGKNGAGKSTLLKILSKVTTPTTGSIRARGRIASLLEVGTGFHPEMTGRENVFMNGAIMGMTKAEISRKLDEIVDFSGVERYLDTPVKRYSSGMTVRLGFAIAAHLDPEILVVDEVLAVGDAEFQKKAIGKMQDVSKGEGRTVLFVSHNMSAVKNLCKTGVILQNGQLAYSGNIDSVIARYLDDGIDDVSEFYPEHNVVKRVSARQVKDKLVIRLEYESEVHIKQPNMGFVFFDAYQTPIFGTNPLKSGLTDFGDAKKKGIVEVEITSPVLYDGRYHIGIWFADGKTKNIFSKEHCLSIDVQNMSFSTFAKTVSEEGYIVPLCFWHFSNK